MFITSYIVWQISEKPEREYENLQLNTYIYKILLVISTMGNNPSYEFAISTPHVWIQKPRLHPTCQSFNESKPISLNAVDPILWQSFSSILDEHVSKLNAGLGFLRKFYFVLAPFLSLAIIGSLMPITDYNVSDFLFFMYLPLFLVCISGLNFILKKNRALDDKIRSVCDDEFKDKFKFKGYTLEYQAQNTGLYRQKHGHTYRVILFHPIPDFQTSNNDNNYVNSNMGDGKELFDRKAWGLEV